MATPIIPWLGGKRRLAKPIFEKFPAHTCYVEAFAGAAPGGAGHRLHRRRRRGKPGAGAVILEPELRGKAAGDRHSQAVLMLGYGPFKATLRAGLSRIRLSQTK